MGGSYVTIEINTKFLVRLVIGLVVGASLVGSYKVGYKRGLSDMYEYISQELNGGGGNGSGNSGARKSTDYRV